MWQQLIGALVIGLLQPLLTNELQQLIAQVKAKVPTLVDADGHVALDALVPLVLTQATVLIHGKNAWLAGLVASMLEPLATHELAALEGIVKKRHPELFDAAGHVDPAAAVPIIVKAALELIAQQHVSW